MTTQPLIKVPSLKSGDAAAAAQLKSLFDEAQNGMRRVVALGMFCYHVKSQLKKNQFQAWLTANCPAISYRSLAAYMQLTRNVLEACGVKTIEAFQRKCSALHFANGSELLLLPDAKVPEEAKPLREKIHSLIDGKSQRALFLEFKQFDEESLENKKKIGRLKGQGGATKEQRARAAAAEESARVTAIELKADEFADWLDENADAKGLGQITGTEAFKKLLTAMEHALGVARKLVKGGAQ